MENGESTKRPHARLEVWRNAMTLVEHVYRISATFPDEERFGLVAQVRRCAVSIPSNIAEGAARSGAAEFLRFLHIARGSLAEVDTQLRLAERLGFCPAEQLLDRVEMLFLTLQLLIRSQQRRIAPN